MRFAWTLVLCSAALAEDRSVAELERAFNEGASSWAGFEPGSWVETRESTADGERAWVVRQTLKRKGEELKLETRRQEVRRTAAGVDEPVGEPEVDDSTPVVRTAYHDLKEVGTEELEFAGVRLSCRVFEGDYEDLTTGRRARCVIWYHPTLTDTGGIGRITIPEDAMPGSYELWDCRVVERGLTRTVGRTAVPCERYLLSYCGNDDGMATTSDVLWSESVPGGYVRRVQRTVGSEGAVVMEWITETTRFHAQKKQAD